MTGSNQDKGPPMRQRIIDLATEAFTGGRDDGERTYLVQKDRPNIALYGKTAKNALAGELYERTGLAAGRAPLDEAWMVIENTLRRTPKRALPLRVGTHGHNSVIDMGDDAGRAIVIDRDGWKIVDRSPITFARTKATMPLPEPVPGGDVNRLFEVVNVAEAQRRLMLGWLVATFTECIAHPIVTFRGEQGSAKTTTARTITTLIDPTAAPLGSPPKDDDRWDASCSAHYVVSVDNASKVSDWWSDSMCRAVTGAGTEKRQLYTDGDIYVTSYRRCIILNGISLSGMLRTDLLERSMAFDLRRPAHRLTDAEINNLLAEILPEVLGGLLDLTVEVSAIEVPRPDLPRMADFGLILAKLDAVLGDGPSAVAAYQDQLDVLFEESLESDVIAKTIIELMDNRGGRTWEGPTADLLQELCWMRISDRLDGKTTWWPDNATQLGHALTRSAPLLRSHSIEIDSIKVGPSSARKRGKRIRQTTTTASSNDGETTDDLVGDLPGVDRVDSVDGLYSTLRFREGEGGRRREHKKETSVHTVQLVHYSGTRCPRCEQNTFDAVEDQCRAVACYPRPRAPGPEPITPAQPWPSSDSDT